MTACVRDCLLQPSSCHTWLIDWLIDWYPFYLAVALLILLHLVTVLSAAECARCDVVCRLFQTFFLRYAGDGFSFVCKANKDCDISVSTRTQCKYCRYQKCLRAGMYRRGIDDCRFLLHIQYLFRLCPDDAESAGLENDWQFMNMRTAKKYVGLKCKSALQLQASGVMLESKYNEQIDRSVCCGPMWTLNSTRWGCCSR